MRFPLLAATLLAVTLSTPVAAQRAAPAPRAWWGSYGYDWDGGRTAGGSGIVVSYRLQLGPNGCRLSATGFQTDEAIRCTATPRAGVLDIAFRSYANGNVRNQYGVARYRPGERLFSLSNRRGTIWTGWGSYSPGDDARPLGRHFRKVA